MKKKRWSQGWIVAASLAVTSMMVTMYARAAQDFPSVRAQTLHGNVASLHSSVPSNLHSGVYSDVHSRLRHHAPSLHPTKPVHWNPLLEGTRHVLTYEHLGAYRGTLYLFEPKHAVHHPLPVVVYFHGGGLIHGTAVIGRGPKYTKEWVVAKLEASLLRKGFAFVSVNYRLAPTYEWPAQIDDSKAAVRFLAAHAKQLDLNPNDFSVIGDSAGGALASLVGLTGSDSTYHKVFTVGPWLRSRSNVRAVVDLFGPVDRRWKAQEWAHRFGQKPNPVFGTFSTNVVRGASAVSYVHSGAPPFFIVQGLNDPVDPPWLSLELYHKLKSVGSPAQILLLKHASHEFIPVGGSVDPSVQEVVLKVTRFLERFGKSPHMPLHTL